MQEEKILRVTRIVIAGCGFTACLAGLWPAVAAEPCLGITNGEEFVCYPWSEIERVTFEEDTLVVLGPNGPERWPVESITGAVVYPDVAGTPAHPTTDGLSVLHLFQNRPNPFSPETEIVFELPRAGSADLRIYGADGRLIRTLFEEPREAGQHTAKWNGLDDAGRRVASGIYFYRLIAPGVEESRRMVLLP